MIKPIALKNPLVEIDLTGADGNAYALLAYAKKLAYQMGLSEEEEKELLREMKAGDYEHLIQVFEQHFGEFVILYR
jgi:hypothetical protein